MRFCKLLLGVVATAFLGVWTWDLNVKLTCVFPPVLALLPMRLGGCVTPPDRNHLTHLQLLYFALQLLYSFCTDAGVYFYTLYFIERLH
jgi:hypothetical protein